MSKILVTGGAGFIGSHLVDRLIAIGHDVVVIDDLSGGTENNLNEQGQFFKGDCRNQAFMDRVFKTVKPDICYHLAANAAENKAQFAPIDITSRNFDAFIKTLTPFIKYGGKRFVFTSSIAVYGALQTPFFEVDTPLPEDLYGISKLACEQTLKVMSQVHEFEYVIARPHNVYGPRQNMADAYRNVVMIWMNAILRDEPWYVYGDGEQTRCFTYIDDCIEALLKCGSDYYTPGKTFNIGSDIQWAIEDLASFVEAITGNSNYTHLPKRPQEVKHAVASHVLAKEFLQYKDTTKIIDGLKKTWEWAQAQGPQEPVYGGIEIQSDKMPKNWLPNEK